MGAAGSDIWGGIKSVGGAIGSGLGAVAGGLGDLFSNGEFGLSGSTGQAMSGSAGSTLPAMSQAVPNIPRFDASTLSSVISPSSMSGPIADVGGGGSGGGIMDLLSKVNPRDISGANYSVPSSPALSGGGGSFNLGGLLKYGVPAAQMIGSVVKGNQDIKGLDPLKDIAGQAKDQSEFLTRNANEAMNGNLPGGAQQSLDQALRSATTAIKSRYASLGLNGSTMEMQDLADAERRAVAARFEIGRGMANTGLSAAAAQTGIASNLYAKILEAETQQGTRMGDALAKFAGLLAQ